MSPDLASATDLGLDGNRYAEGTTSADLLTGFSPSGAAVPGADVTQKSVPGAFDQATDKHAPIVCSAFTLQATRSTKRGRSGRPVGRPRLPKAL